MSTNSPKPINMTFVVALAWTRRKRARQIEALSRQVNDFITKLQNDANTSNNLLAVARITDPLMHKGTATIVVIYSLAPILEETADTGPEGFKPYVGTFTGGEGDPVPCTVLGDQPNLQNEIPILLHLGRQGAQGTAKISEIGPAPEPEMQPQHQPA